jgi:ATP-dependent RNA helicase RhlB
MRAEHFTDVRFDSFELPRPVLQGLAEAGFTFCTPVQAETLPITLKGHDVAGQAQTGTGKTAAFLVATLNRLLTREPPAARRPNQPLALIMAPTRELAVQIGEEAKTLGKFAGLRLTLAYGGVGYESQREAIKAGVDILIGTPGRLIDYFKQHVFDLHALQVLVLDEADRMFDLGFIKDIRFLLRRMPKPQHRLSMLFSATLSWRVTELAYEHMNNPHVIRTAPQQVTAPRVREVLYHVGRDEKIALLLGLLGAMKPERSLVFVNTKRAADKVGAYLAGNGFSVATLSGDVEQRRRQQILERFKHGHLDVLVATDVAARGLHIPDVSHVFNFDLPQDPEDYVHRIGRTARLGASGVAVSLACEEYVYSLPDIEEYIGHGIPAEPVTEEILVEPRPPAHWERPRRSGPAGRRRRAGSAPAAR